MLTDFTYYSQNYAWFNPHDILKQLIIYYKLSSFSLKQAKSL